MQITISADQMHQLREWGQTVLLPLIAWGGRRTIKALKETLNEIITENVNRVRDETLQHIDEQLAVHLESDARQFADLRKALDLPSAKP
jgi:hypothetical protein